MDAAEGGNVFGIEIKSRRKSRRMSLTDLSAVTGIDRGLLSKLENRSRRPSADQINSLATALDLSEEVLLAQAGLLPPDVREALDSVASTVTASTRQSVEAIASPTPGISEDLARILTESKERPARKVAGPLEGDLEGSKSSTAYRAHSYHTKVPPETIIPFIEHFTRPGDVILDPFCGSGMTGVAALATGRHAILSDLAPAAVHIARNYTSSCSPVELTTALEHLRQKVRPTMAWLYEIAEPGAPRERTEYVTWSDVLACPHCEAEWTFWEAARGKDGHIVGKVFPCPACNAQVSKAQCRWAGERPVEVNLSVDGIRTRIVRPPSAVDTSLIEEAAAKPIPYWMPTVPFAESREMWRASHRAMGITSVAGFYSKRNLHALASIRHEILMLKAGRIREALLFAFTAMANRASRRYQWNAKRPTNVMAGTLYVSSLRYEWNVWSLFERKARDIIRYYERFPANSGKVDCIQSDATDLGHVPDGSVDFVYMDPPFGANIFYADVSLLWEAWLGSRTDTSAEIVVNKHLKADEGGKSIRDYGDLMTRAFSEVRRVLKPDGHAVLVFSNTDDKVWESIRSGVNAAGLVVQATAILDKGQRSIKGVQADLGRQKATRVDLVLTLAQANPRADSTIANEVDDLGELIHEALKAAPSQTLSTDRIYSRIVESLILNNVSVAGINMTAVELTCERTCRTAPNGEWTLVPAPDSLAIASPYGSIAEEYVGDPQSLFSLRAKRVRRVAKPLTAAVPGTRNTALYNAHSYMTKVPPEAIEPFIEHYTRPGDIVLDMFAGSGMTGVAAASLGRRALLRDIAVVSAHLSYNHTRPCCPESLKEVWRELYDSLRPTFGEMYRVPGAKDAADGYAHYTLWSERYSCPECRRLFTLYDAIDTDSGRVGATIQCPKCHSELRRQRLRPVSSVPVLINYQAPARGRRDQRRPSRKDIEHISSFSREGVSEWFPCVPMGPDRDMYNISALHLRGISEVADFYTPRNLQALSLLLSAIRNVKDVRIRQVLTFAFTNTAWHGTRMRRFNARGGQRPLTGTLYIPQISSEVNVLEVLNNKVRQLRRYYSSFPQHLPVPPPVVTVGSATSLEGVPDNSVDYVFTDPPFGSNIFYADCNLITESWLGSITKVENEAVVNRTLSPSDGGKSLSDYGALLTQAIAEAYRVLKPNGWMTMVFHNTDPNVWGALQAAAQSTGFRLAGAGSLNRKERSHKGYKGRSDEEKVAHFDVVMSLQKTKRNGGSTRKSAPPEYLSKQVARLSQRAPKAGRTQWIHSELIQALVADGYDLGSVSFAEVSAFIPAK